MATLPPIEQISKEDGSGGYHSPAAAAAAFTSALNRPGCTTAVRVTGSMVISRIRSVHSTMPSLRAVLPPDRLVPAPRVVTGIRWAVAQRNADCTCSVDSARTTASGTPASGSKARSMRYLSTRSASVITTSGPSPVTSSETSSATGQHFVPSSGGSPSTRYFSTALSMHRLPDPYAVCPSPLRVNSTPDSNSPARLTDH